MRIPGRAVLAACAVALAVGCLAGCTSPDADADPTKTPKPTPTPVFTSDADALAAATDVYTKYVRASDDIGHDGGKNPERISPYVNKAGLANEVEQAKKLAEEHAHEVGYTKINNVILQGREEVAGIATVTIYACQDLSDVDVLDANGSTLIAPDRADFVAYVAKLQSSSNGSLIVQSNKYWSGGGICKV
jgi:hypothetical protein